VRFILISLAATVSFSMNAQTLPVARPVAKEAIISDFQLAGPLMQGGFVRGRAPVGTVELLLNMVPIKVGLDGVFVIGFGPEAASTATLIAKLSDGRVQSRVLTIAARQYNEQRVDGVPPRTVEIPDDQKARRASEIAQVRAARSVVSDRRDWMQNFQWPVTGRISGIYGSRRVYNGKPGSSHLGVDIARPSGTSVVAPAGGVVKLAQPDFLLEGGLIILDHGFNVYSTFLHLSKINIKPGDIVIQGQKLGAVGATGRATGPHLHWNLNWGDVRLDAQSLEATPEALRSDGSKAPALSLQPGLRPAPIGPRITVSPEALQPLAQ
jgi:murein DD-endopeptidase MepM/ murein hydrolase activator NlpD